jgi:hypothetical protein
MRVAVDSGGMAKVAITAGANGYVVGAKLR